MRGLSVLGNLVVRYGLGTVILGNWLAVGTVQAGTVTIAATPSVVEEVEAVAQAFEAAYPNDRVQIALVSENELKTSGKRLPMHLIVSDNPSFIEWLEARDVVMRATISPAVHVPLAIVTAASRGEDIGSVRDLHHRLQRGEIKIAIPDPTKTDCGRRAEVLLRSLGVTTTSVDRVVRAKRNTEVLELVRLGEAHFGVVFAPEAMQQNSVTIHAVSAPHAGSPVHSFAVNRVHQNHPVAKRFLAFVNSAEAQQVLKTNGYEVLSADQVKEDRTVMAAVTSVAD